MNKIKRYHKILHEWRHIPRAHEPKKPLAEKAKKILAVILFRMHPEKNLITVNNKFLSKFTGCGPKQNRNLIRQLDNIFNIEFKQKFRHEGKTHWNVYVITSNKNAIEILNNPELYYSQKVENIEEKRTPKITVVPQHLIDIDFS